MSIGLYIVLAPLYLKSVRKLQEKRFVFVKILAIIIPENGAKVSKIKCFQFAQQTLSIKENRSHYAFRCQACHSARHVVRRTYFLVKGIQDEQMLLQELERRKTWENVLEPAENRNPLYILLSGAAFIFCVILCILSHPAVARMSGEIYFPCMGASMVTFCFLLYFIIRQHRGE